MLRQRKQRTTPMQHRMDRPRSIRRSAAWDRPTMAPPQNEIRRRRSLWSETSRMQTILLVDPDLEHLERQGGLLEHAGYRTVAARDGRSALFILRSGMIVDLIVTEYAVPDMASAEFLPAVRQEVPTVPVIVVTCCNKAESYVHAAGLGVHGYLSKPLLGGELRGLVRQAFAERRSGTLPAGNT